MASTRTKAKGTWALKTAGIAAVVVIGFRYFDKKTPKAKTS
jgi:hypothetical protein